MTGLGQSLAAGQHLKQEHRQQLSLSQQQRLKFLQMPLSELRSALQEALKANPAVEELGNAMEVPLSALSEQVERREREGADDYFDEEVTPGVSYADAEQAERRQRLLEGRTAEETLEGHLESQLASSGLSAADQRLAEMLIGELSGEGQFVGSVADVAMAFGVTARHVREVLAAIRSLDPVGCGYEHPGECLLAQVAAAPAGTFSHPQLVKRLLALPLEELAAAPAAIGARLGVAEAEVTAALGEIRRELRPHPGLDYPSRHETVEYLNPEVHSKCKDGVWYPVTDGRSVPEIRISRNFVELLESPALKREERAYMREQLAAAELLRAAVDDREETLLRVAEVIYARQQEFFEQGYRALKPLTESEVAAQLKLDASTVSRTVLGKYAQTPQGCIELRKFFGTSAQRAQTEVLECLQQLVASEDKARPLTDGELLKRLEQAGFNVARRTVVKYRQKLGILEVSRRKRSS